MSLHVGLFVNYFSIVRGGAESYVADLSQSLESLGLRVTIVTGRPLLRRPRPAREGVEILYEPCLYGLREAGRLVPGRVEWLVSTAAESFYTHFARRHVGRFDVVHCHGYDTAAAALGAPGRRGPVVLTMHGPPSLKPRVGRLLRGLDAVVSPSDHLRDLVARHHGITPALVPMGIDLDRFAARSRTEARSRLGWSDRPTVLFCGRLILQKGADTLLRAFARLEPSKAARLKIVGEGIFEKRLRRLAAVLGRAPEVDFLGTVPRSLMPLVHAAADVTVLPSLYENFPMVAMEALASGTPLIVSDAVGEITGRFPEVSIFPAGDHEALASRMADGLAGRIGAVPRERLEPHRWRHVAESYVAIYRAAARRRAA